MARATIALGRFIEFSSRDFSLVDVAIAILPLPHGAAPQRLRLESVYELSTGQRWSQICGSAKFLRDIHRLKIFSVAAIRLSGCVVYEQDQFTPISMTV
jgi:hypothetical protein